MTVIVAIAVLFLMWLWVYCIYRTLCWFFSLYLAKDELSLTAQRRARLWGIFGATFFGAVPVMILQGGIDPTTTLDQAATDALAVLVGPFIEEVSKGIASLVAFFYLSKPSGRKLFVIGALSGVGFHLTETLLYSLGATLNGGNVGNELVIRAIALSLMHPLAAGMTGLGLGLAASSKSKLLKLLFAGLGFSCGVFIHVWNNGVALMINRGERLDQSEFFGIHLLLAVSLLIISRVRIASKEASEKGTSRTLAREDSEAVVTT